MADIELVIKIPKEVYETLRKTYVIIGGQSHRGGASPMSVIYNAAVNGTPLPKRHGRLIDADTLDDVVMKMNENGAQITRNEYKLIDNVIFEMLTIIEADRNEE